LIASPWNQESAEESHASAESWRFWLLTISANRFSRNILSWEEEDLRQAPSYAAAAIDDEVHNFDRVA
jgi:hypothetical protein